MDGLFIQWIHFFMAIYYANSWMVYDGKKTNNGWFEVMWVKQWHFYHPWLGMVNIPPIKNGDDWGMVYYCFTMFYQQLVHMYYTKFIVDVWTCEGHHQLKWCKISPILHLVAGHQTDCLAIYLGSIYPNFQSSKILFLSFSSKRPWNRITSSIFKLFFYMSST